MNINVDEINKTIELVKKFNSLPKYRSMSFEDKDKELSAVFSGFKEKYPTIFKVILRGDNLENLNVMLSTLNQINEGSVDKKRAEIILGERLAKQYIYPVVGQNSIDFDKKKKDMNKFLNKKD